MTHPYTQPADPNQYQPAPEAKRRNPRKGAATTALVLGIVAICGSPIPILNNATIIAGFIGVVFGIVALFGTKIGTAITGLVLAVAGIAIGIALQIQWAKQLEKIGNDLKNIPPMPSISVPPFPTLPSMPTH
jgi:hypothetical protein